MKDKIRRFIPLCISVLTIVVTILLQFAVFSTNDEFKWSEFLPQLVINVFLLVAMAVVWLNSGTDRAKREENSAYRQNSLLYASLIKSISDEKRLGELRNFCDIKTEELRQNKITAKLMSVGIDRDKYDSELRYKSNAELIADNYNARQRRMIRRIKEGHIKVHKIQAMDLMSDSKTTDNCGVNYDERADKAFRVVFRAVKSVLIAFVLAVLVVDPAQDIRSIAAWVMFVMRLFTVAYTAYSAEHEGYTRITETKNKVILRRIAFLHEFKEWGSVPRLNVGKESI